MIYRDITMKHEGKKSPANGGSRMQDNIKMSVKEVGYEGVDRIRLV
jgi:hypothetical protein